MTTILSIDPGVTTGYAIGKFTAVSPYRLVEAGVTHDGLDGFVDWWRDPHGDDIIVAERFVLRANPFLADITAKMIEGFLVGRLGRGRVSWRLRTAKSLVPDAVLKTHGLWQTGSMVGHVDGRDANDAIIHGLGWLVEQRHTPTLKAYFNTPEEVQ